MKKEKMNIPSIFRHVFPDPEYYEAKKILMPEADSQTLNKAIIKDIRRMWDNQDIDWLCNYINQNLIDALEPELNLKQITKLCNLLLRLGVHINYGIFQILMTECPILEDLFGSILGYKPYYTDADITGIVNYLDYQKVLIYYCQYHDKWRGTFYDRENIELGIRKPIEKIELAKSKLTLMEEQRLIAKAQLGSMEAIEELIKHNYALVMKVVLNYLGRGVDKDDLLQEGLIGLMLAIQNYDLKNKTRLSSYAYTYVEAYLKKAIGNVKSPLHIPKSLRVKCTTFTNVQKILALKMQKEPTMGEIANYMQEPVANIELYASLTQPTLELTPEVVKDTALSNEEILLEQSLITELNQIIALLPSDYQLMIKQYFGFEGNEPMSCTKIGAKSGTKRQTINLKINEALRIIKFFLILAGYQIKGWEITASNMPTYQELIAQKGTNIYYIGRILNLKPKKIMEYGNQQIDPYVYLAYQKGLITINKAIYFAFLDKENRLWYLTKLLTKQLNSKRFGKIVAQNLHPILAVNPSQGQTISLRK